MAKTFKLKKSLGQNFLKDIDVINNIIYASNVNKNDLVIEIGPGNGALTKYLLKEANKVISIEIDNDLISILKKKFSNYNNFTLINSDFLKIDKKDLKIDENDLKIKVIANLPYYITTAIITKILLEFDYVSELYIMVQKEVGERITSDINKKTYGSLSVFCQTLCDAKKEFIVDRNSFFPIPNVDSIIISLKRKKNIDINIYEFQKFVKNCFRLKRKTLVNNLNNTYNLEKNEIISLLNSCELTSNIRSEQININKFKELFYKFNEKGNK